MSMTHLPIERIPGYDHVVRIRLENIQDPQRLSILLHNSFEICFKNRDFKILLDMQKVQYPSSSLIALFVEASSRVRRVNGDVKFINLTKSARNNLATFSPISYLSLEGDEKYALDDFGKAMGEKKINQMSTLQTQPQTQPLPSVDIVEDPIIEKLQNTFEQGNNIQTDVHGDAPNLEAVAKEEIVPNQKNVSEKDDRLEENNYHLRVKSETKNLYSICDFVVDIADKVGFDTKQLGKTKIAVYEACLNVIEHAYHSNSDNWIDVTVVCTDDKFEIQVRDYGIGFEGFDNNKKNYDVLSAMDGRQTGGFGLYIIRRSMDELYYEPNSESGNLLRMVKYMKTSP